MTSWRAIGRGCLVWPTGRGNSSFFQVLVLPTEKVSAQKRWQEPFLARRARNARGTFSYVRLTSSFPILCDSAPWRESSPRASRKAEILADFGRALCYDAPSLPQGRDRSFFDISITTRPDRRKPSATAAHRPRRQTKRDDFTPSRSMTSSFERAARSALSKPC